MIPCRLRRGALLANRVAPSEMGAASLRLYRSLQRFG
jgi:hypothetical protein